MKTLTTSQMIENAFNRGYILEQEIITIKARLNRGAASNSDLSLLYDKALNISQEQTEKGLNFLLNLWQTPEERSVKITLSDTESKQFYLTLSVSRLPGSTILVDLRLLCSLSI